MSERHVDIAPQVAPPPHDTEIEAALLAAILTNNRAYDAVSEFLLPDHFYTPVLGRIFAAATKAIERGETASPLTLHRQFNADPDLADIEGGGGRYLYDLAASVVTVTGAKDYGRRIVDLWQRRAALALIETHIEALRNPDPDITAAGTLASLDGEIAALSMGSSDVVAPATLGDAAYAALQRTESAIQARAEGRTYGVPTGLRDLDDMIGGLHGGQLILLAGRPAMGKSAMGVTIACHAAEAGDPVLLHSLEMTAAEIGQRVLAMETGIAADRQNKGRVSFDELTDTLADAADALREARLWIDDRPHLDFNTIRARARQMKRSPTGLGLLVIDHLGLMNRGGDARTPDHILLGRITSGLKTLAKQLDIPILLLHQLSRANEMREDKRPQLSDLRGSGEIEQDADVVLFVHRESYYLERQEPVSKPGEDRAKFDQRHFDWRRATEDAAGKGEIIVAKCRQGRTGVAKLRYDGPRTMWADLDAPVTDERQEALSI